MATERLQVILEMLAGQYKKEARDAARATSEIAEGAKNASQQGNFATRTFSKWGDEIKTFVALRAGRAIKDFARESVEAASALNESFNAVEQVFDSAASKVTAFGEISAQAAGLSQREFQQMATVTGALLTNLGFNYDEAANQSIRLTTRAGDLASVFDKDVGQALEAINSSLQGQQRPLRQFGISLDDAAIRAKAVELGLAETTGEVDKHGKAVATLELIYEQSAAAQGDFLRTSDDLANAQRIAAASYENAQARFGEAARAPLAAAADLGATVLDSVTALGLFGDAQSTVAQQSLRMKESVERITEAIQNGESPALAFQDALLHMAENGTLTTGAMEALAAAAGVTIDNTDVFAESLAEMAREAGYSEETIAELVGAITGSGDAAADAEGDHLDLADALGEEAGNALEAASSQRELISAYQEAANPIFAAQRSLERYQTATENLISVQGDGESTAQDIAEAQLDVAAAALEAEGALLALGDGSVNDGIRAIATALNIGDEEARDLLQTLGLLDGMTVTSVVETRFREVGNRPTSRTGQHRVSGHMHTGGPVRGGSTYMVGERGPELFTAPANGQIISNTDLNRLLSAMNGQTLNRNLSVTMNNPTLANDPMQTIRAAFALDTMSNI
jgi:hypothetical protein